MWRDMKVLVLAVFSLVGVVLSSPDDDDQCKDLASVCGSIIDYCDSPEYGRWMERYCMRSCAFCEPMPVPPSLPPTYPPIDPPVDPTLASIATACGKPAIKGTRVIGGKDAVRGSWPWQILMLWEGQAACGGSLISPTWVVSAAHCVYGDEGTPEKFTIRVGEYDRNNIEGSEQTYDVEKVISHPDYNQRVLNNDIALFKLSKPVVFNKYVSPICLPEKEADVGTECYITGWGKTVHTGRMTRILQQGVLPVVSQSTCDKLNVANIEIPITEAMICGGNGGKSTLSGCHGDSGGPYVCQRDGRWELQGAVSHGSSVCNSTETYTVFSKVVYFKDWIENMMSTE